MGDNILEIKNLKVEFLTEDGYMPAVDDVSFNIKKNTTLALVGESGCGKSVTALSILGLINKPGKITQGTIKFEDKDLLKLNNSGMRSIRGNKISMIFQDPMTSLNPVYRCGDQISEVILQHNKVSKEEAREKSIELLRQMGIPNPEKRVDDYPHQMSGGMRQRVMIAMAIACDVSLLVADEPTTALDVTVQAQILELLQKIQEKRDMSILLITHDLGVVAETAKEVAIMYAGKIQEYASADIIFKEPMHPYTKSLMRSVPNMYQKKDVLETITGNVPSLENMPKGCRFHTRCERCMEKCKVEEPTFSEVSPGHKVRCFLYQ